MGKQVPGSFRQQILEFVLSRSRSSISDVLHAVGGQIKATTASRTLQSWVKLVRRTRPSENIQLPPIGRAVQRGKRIIVTNTLTSLCRQGKISRIGVGIYGPPLPKVFIPESNKTA